MTSPHFLLLIITPNMDDVDPSTCGQHRRRNRYSHRHSPMGWTNHTLRPKMWTWSGNHDGLRLWGVCAILISSLLVCLSKRVFPSSFSILFFCLRLFRLVGSWDGEIRLWKLDSKLRSFALIGSIPALGVVNSLQFISLTRDVAESFSWASPPTTTKDNSEVPRQANGKPAAVALEKKSLLLVACVGQEMRFGRWVQKKGEGVLNGALVTLLHPRTSQSHS